MSFKHDDDIRFFLSERNDFISKDNINIDLILLGDSITRRYDISRYFPNEYRILNSGIGGDNIQNMISRLYPDVLNLKPTNVLFMGGINNLRNCLINNNDFITCKDELISGYKEIISQCKKSNVNLTMSFIIKNHEPNLNFSVLNNWIDEVNNEIRDLCL
ncbi:MAG: SGNH/GDSL hydrolase family protein, partial [Coprobacillaceae bacterium]